MPDLKAGDVVKVHRKIKEGEKERIQVFEGMIIAIKGRQSSSPMITVRKVSFGVGVELILPVYSPQVEKIEIVKRATLKKAKLYYMRNKTVKSLRLKYKELADFTRAEEKEEVIAEEAAAGEIKTEAENNKEVVESEKKSEEKGEKK